MLVDNVDATTMHVLDFYQNLFSKQSKMPVDYSLVADIVPFLVTSEDNLSLTRMPSVDEIQAIIFDMDPSSSPGPG